MRPRPWLALALLAAALPARAQDAPPPPDKPAAPAAADTRIVPTKWLLVDGPDLRLRRPVSASAIARTYLLDRDAPPPKEGDELTGERGVAVKWRAAEAKDGKLDTGEAACAYTTVECDRECVATARVAGAATLWVNGEPFVGDLYGYGFEGVPVALRKGANRVFVSGLRGGIEVTFFPGRPHVGEVSWDATLPDVEKGSKDPVDVGIVVVNATDRAVDALVGSAMDAPDAVRVHLLPTSLTKVPLRLPVDMGDEGHGFVGVTVTVPSIPAGSARQVVVNERKPGAPLHRTRVSEIDGSVQEYAVVEPAPTLVPVPTRIVLSLHGASVPCVGQARAYSRHPGTWIVCPTNRRPFGFDWQDWGRTDAYETLAAFGDRFDADVSRVLLTGHSMGGHGTWHLAANDPDRFAAIAPSAGWASFDSYTGARPRTALTDLWHGADEGSDTLALVSNLAPIPTYVLHGEKDDNVPLAQAELMLKALREAGGSPASHVEEGAGHWWDGDAAPGADCVDWPGIFDLFAKTDPEAPAPSTLDWTTVDPSVDSRHFWLSAAMPWVYGTPMRIVAAWDAAKATATLTTTNARRIDLAPPDAPSKWTLVIDGAELPVGGPRVYVERAPEAGWFAVANLPDNRKKPLRSGPLKNAFGRRFAMVVPTLGTEEETREETARIRFDAEQWWYRGNGFADVVLDKDVLAHPQTFELRNLVLYGNADTNAAWRRVLGETPVDVRRGAVKVGDRAFAGDDAACFLVRPRADDPVGLAAALGDTGPRGCRVAMLHALFVSGTGYPDYLAWGSAALEKGDGGVLAAGWFDPDWKLDGRGFLAPETKAPKEEK